MENVQRLTQAYSQAPWRKQVQMIGIFLLVLVTTAIVAGIYLNITARATTVGREIQEMQVLIYGYHSLFTTPQSGEMPVEELRQNIASLQAQLAYLTSYEVMDARARSLGFHPTDPEEIVYLEIDGYVAPQPVRLAPPPSPVVVPAPIVSSEFNEPLFTWLADQFRQTARMFGEVQP
jgi:hypothetical protein